MAEKKIIAVMGATGAQGGGLVRAILRDKAGGFAARAITRNAGSDKAKALAQAGAEVVAADAGDEASLQLHSPARTASSASRSSGSTSPPSGSWPTPPAWRRPPSRPEPLT